MPACTLDLPAEALAKMGLHLTASMVDTQPSLRTRDRLCLLALGSSPEAQDEV